LTVRVTRTSCTLKTTAEPRLEVQAYVARVDEVLSRGHELFRQGAGVAALHESGGSAPPAPPPGGGALGAGSAAAGGGYEEAVAGVAGLDSDTAAAVGAGGQVGQQGWANSGAVRDTTRAGGGDRAGNQFCGRGTVPQSSWRSALRGVVGAMSLYRTDE
jgi:hypothetical protein